jgi:hypothetical protein
MEGNMAKIITKDLEPVFHFVDIGIFFAKSLLELGKMYPVVVFVDGQ